MTQGTYYIKAFLKIILLKQALFKMARGPEVRAVLVWLAFG